MLTFKAPHDLAPAISYSWACHCVLSIHEQDGVTCKRSGRWVAYFSGGVFHCEHIRLRWERIQLLEVPFQPLATRVFIGTDGLVFCIYVKDNASVESIHSWLLAPQTALACLYKADLPKKMEIHLYFQAFCIPKWHFLISYNSVCLVTLEGLTNAWINRYHPMRFLCNGNVAQSSEHRQTLDSTWQLLFSISPPSAASQSSKLFYCPNRFRGKRWSHSL